MDFQVDIYEIQDNGRCKADLQIADLNLYISGFRVVPGTNGKGAIVHMPKGMGSDWKYTEIEWAKVREMISGEYLRNPQIVEIYSRLAAEPINPVPIITKGPANQKNAGVDLFVNLYGFDSEKGTCLASIILPVRKIRVEGFTVKQMGKGIQVYMPKFLGTRWPFDEISWKEVQKEIAEQYRREKQYLEAEAVPACHDGLPAPSASGIEEERKIQMEKAAEKEKHPIQEEPLEPTREMSDKKKKFLDMRNQLGRVRNAENTAFAFVPHSILKLVPVEHSKENNTQKIIRALNSPQGGIGNFEIELLDWISKLKYVSKTMILDLVLSGYISRENRESITANKMSDVMNRLYKYDLIEMSRFTSVDDTGASIEEGSHSIYRIHTLGATGYNLLREMGRHPERRNPFGVLADGNTVKKHLSATQWLGYWLTHYSMEDILDYSINTIVNQMGLQWNGAKIYAGVTLDSLSLVAEPVRRCEEFEKEDNRTEIREKLLRLIGMFDNEDQLYTAKREQVVFSTRPVITYISEDDEHMKELVECIEDIMEAHPQQEVWFTTDLRMFNYNGAGQRFFILKDGGLSILNLEEKTGVKEMTMEERGGQHAIQNC